MCAERCPFLFCRYSSAVIVQIPNPEDPLPDSAGKTRRHLDEVELQQANEARSHPPDSANPGFNPSQNRITRGVGKIVMCGSKS